MADASSDAQSNEHDATCLPVGTRLGEFEITGLIGIGGFCIVYSANDSSLGREVALKEYMPSSLASRTPDLRVAAKSERHQETFSVGLRSFVNEARLLANFDHPALVKVFRFWEANGTAYMVMPYYRGVTLRSALKNLGEAPDEESIKQALDPLLEALAVIHAENIFHRDIAPDNIIMLPNGRPVLLDFGAARRVIGDHTQALTVILKPGFAPVEQYANGPEMRQGPWTDIYAMAAVVYYCISGKTPTPSVSRMLRDTMVPAVEIGRGRYSEAFLQAVDRGLTVRLEDRTPSVARFREELGLAPIGEGAPRTRLAAATEILGASQARAMTGSGESVSNALGPEPQAPNPKETASRRDPFSAQVSGGDPGGADVEATVVVQPRTALSGRADAGAAEPASDSSPKSTAPPMPAPAADRGTAERSADPMAAGITLGGVGDTTARPSGAPKTGATGPKIAAALGLLVALVAGTWFAFGGKSGGQATGSGASTQGVAADAKSPAAAADATPAPKAAEPPPAPPFTAVAALDGVMGLRDPQWPTQVAVTKDTLKIDKDNIAFRIRSSLPGFVYVFIVGTGDKDFWQLFPLASDQDNRIQADKDLLLPRRGGPWTASGPPGTNRLLVMVSPSRRDFSRAGLGVWKAGNAQDPWAHFNLDAARAAWERDGLRVFAGVPIDCNLSVPECDRFGAARFDLREIQ